MTFEQIKWVLMRTGSKHARHSRHGVVETHHNNTWLQTWWTCRCGHKGTITDDQLSLHKRRRRLTRWMIDKCLRNTMLASWQDMMTAPSIWKDCALPMEFDDE